MNIGGHKPVCRKQQAGLEFRILSSVDLIQGNCIWILRDNGFSIALNVPNAKQSLHCHFLESNF